MNKLNELLTSNGIDPVSDDSFIENLYKKPNEQLHDLFKTFGDIFGPKKISLDPIELMLDDECSLGQIRSARMDVYEEIARQCHVTIHELGRRPITKNGLEAIYLGDKIIGSLEVSYNPMTFTFKPSV